MISSKGKVPSLMSVRLVASIIVEGVPSLTLPPSIIMSILPAMSLNTISASTGLGRPERFALGAAIGVPSEAIIA